MAVAIFVTQTICLTSFTSLRNTIYPSSSLNSRRHLLLRPISPAKYYSSRELGELREFRNRTFSRFVPVDSASKIGQLLSGDYRSMPQYRVMDVQARRGEVRRGIEHAPRFDHGARYPKAFERMKLCLTYAIRGMFVLFYSSGYRRGFSQVWHCAASASNAAMLCYALLCSTHSILSIPLTPALAPLRNTANHEISSSPEKERYRGKYTNLRLNRGRNSKINTICQAW